MPEFCLSRGALDNLNIYDSSIIVPLLSCSLRSNWLGDETGVALGKALETNTSLQTLK